ncbi:UNVERIFIED_ORG: hypothetical protein GGD47_004573 [Rhizobium etli]
MGIFAARKVSALEGFSRLGGAMRTLISALTLCIAIAVAAPSPTYVSLPGYAFKTKPNCQRHKPKARFDARCDWPRLGFKDFTPPMVTVLGI